MTQLIISAAALYGMLGVMLGAFGAHAMSARLTPDMLAIWHTAVQYQFYHALALLGLGVLVRTGVSGHWPQIAALCFCAGIFIFSGSLYLLAVSGIRWLGAVTPLGGLLLIAGWVALFVGVLRGL